MKENVFFYLLQRFTSRWCGLVTKAPVAEALVAEALVLEARVLEARAPEAPVEAARLAKIG